MATTKAIALLGSAAAIIAGFYILDHRKVPDQNVFAGSPASPWDDVAATPTPSPKPSFSPTPTPTATPATKAWQKRERSERRRDRDD